MSNFAAMGFPMYMSSYEEGEQFQLAQEKLSEIILDDIDKSPDLFVDFFLDLMDSKDGVPCVKLIRDLTIDKDGYLDKGHELHEFMRSRIEKHVERLAGQKLRELR